jgi:type I restriction enzyme S subunit
VYCPSGRQFVRSQNVDWGTLRLRDLAFLDEQTHASFRVSEIRGGDVLLNITGASIGRSAVATESLDGGNVNQHVCEIRLDKRRMDPMFVCSVLLSQLGQDQIASFQAGGNRQGLNFQQVGSITIPTPPLDEQRAIARVLADVTRLIVVVERLIAKKEAMKQGMMQQLLTGKTRLPGFSKPWREVNLGDVATMGSGGTPPSTMPRYYGGGIPWVSISDMTSASKYVHVTEKTLSREGLSHSPAKLYAVGVVLYAMYASLGECALPVGWMSSSQAILAILPGSELDREYLYYDLCSRKRQVKESGQQSTQSNLNAGMVRNFMLELPEPEEQRAIAAVLASVDDELDLLKTRLHKAKAIKQGMMQELLTGRTRLPVMETAA